MKRNRGIIEISGWLLYVAFNLLTNYWLYGVATPYIMLLCGFTINILTFYYSANWVLRLYSGRDKWLYLSISVIAGYCMRVALAYIVGTYIFQWVYQSPPASTNLKHYLIPVIPHYITYFLLGAGYFYLHEAYRNKIKVTQSEADKLAAENKLQASENARLQSEAKAISEQQLRLTAEAAAREEELKRIQAEAFAKDEELKRMQAEAATKNEEIKRVQAESAAKDETLKRMQVEVKAREMEHELLKLRIAQLYAQLSPHFLRNVLASIQGYISAEDNIASDQIANLATLMDYFLKVPGEDYKEELHNEVNAIEKLIALIRPQFLDDFYLNFIKEGPTDGKRVIGHTLVTMVENMITYGYLDEPEMPATITLKVKGNKLQFSTFNWIKENRQRRGNGLGTSNIRRMLDIVYPDAYEYTVETDDITYKTELTLTL